MTEFGFILMFGESDGDDLAELGEVFEDGALFHGAGHFVDLDVGFLVDFLDVDEGDHSDGSAVEEQVLSKEDAVEGLLGISEGDDYSFKKVGYGVDFVLDVENLAQIPELLDEVVSGHEVCVVGSVNHLIGSVCLSIDYHQLDLIIFAIVSLTKYKLP